MNSPQPVIIKLNEKFRINLPENHGSGYNWRLNDTDDGFIVDHFNTVWEGNSKGVFFYFKAVKPGTTILSFTSRQYNAVNSVKEMSVTIID